MKRTFSVLVTLSVLILASLACNLPTRVAERAASSDPLPLPEEPTPTQAAEQATEEPLDEDLVSAALSLSELPDGFAALNDAQMKEFGISEDSLANNFTGVLSEARPQNYTAFHKPGANPQIVVSTVLAPLTGVERIAFDVYMANPELVASEFAEGAGAQEVNLIPGARQVGDSSVGLSFLSEMSGIPMRSDAVIARRDQTIQVAMISYPDGGTPDVAAVDIARLMDQKIEGALR